MRVGAFDLKEPLPQFNRLQALVMLSPWIDAGRVGSGVLTHLEEQFHAREVGKLEKPGVFYDFTRYRPVVYRVEGKRQVRIPNTLITYAQRVQGRDFLFLHCLEPHMFGETYVESVLKLLEKLKVERYVLLGGMFDSTPHTRPLLASGTASDEAMAMALRRLGLVTSNYQGPTTINTIISDEAPKQGTETTTMIARLPYYTQLEDDYAGQELVLRLLASVYELPLALGSLKKKGEEQYREVGLAVRSNPRLAEVLHVLEASYDAQASKSAETTEPPLSPQVERFLRELDKGFSSDG